MELAGFLNALDGATPSGVDLRNDAAFHQIERGLDPAARNVRISNKPGEPPSNANVDWADLLDQARDLAQSGRDLRLLVIATRAMTNTDGFAGLVAGLDLLTQTVTTYWDSVHPMLRDRKTPKEASLRRSNALKQLENDDNGLLGDLEMNPVMTLRGIGIITGQNLVDAARTDFDAMNEAPSGLSTAEKDAILAAHQSNQKRVFAACRAVAAEDSELASQLRADADAVIARIDQLCTGFSSAAGLESGTGLILPELKQFFERARAIMEAEMTQDATAPAPSNAAASNAPTPGAAAAPAATHQSGVISSRADVERSLTEIIEFYARTEPSSPIPHLAERMRRMVHMNFLELMEEIAPSGMKEFRNVAGVADSKAK